MEPLFLAFVFSSILEQDIFGQITKYLCLEEPDPALIYCWNLEFVSVFSGKKYNFNHFEKCNAFQNAWNYIFFSETKWLKKICVPTLPRIFRPVTQNTHFFLFGLILPLIYNVDLERKKSYLSSKHLELLGWSESSLCTPVILVLSCCDSYLFVSLTGSQPAKEWNGCHGESGGWKDGISTKI